MYTFMHYEHLNNDFYLQKRAREKVRCVQIFNKSTWVSLFSVEREEGGKCFFIKKISFQLLLHLLNTRHHHMRWCNKKSWRCNIFHNNEGNVLAVLPSLSPCAAFNGLLFVLGMLIKIKNHLGNKSFLLGFIWSVTILIIHALLYYVTHNAIHTTRAASIHSI